MNKFLNIFCALIVTFSFSSYTKQDSLHKPEKGKFAPEIVFSDKETSSLNFQKHQLTLIQFWASYDALSRINNRKFNQLTTDYGDITFVSIALENYPSVFEETMKADGLNPENHYCESPQSAVADLYKLNKNGFGNFLINQQGIIIAQNISAEDLQELLLAYR